MSGVVLFSRLAHPGLGDLVQRNIFLHQLKQAHPGDRVTWVLGTRVASIPVQRELVESHSYADEVLFCPDAMDDDPAAMADFRAALAARAFSSCVVDPASIGLGAADAEAAGISTRIAVPTGGADDASITAPMPISTGVPSLYDFAVALAGAIGQDPPEREQTVPPLPWRPESLPDWSLDRPLIGLHPGGAPGWNRRWPAERFAELGARLAQSYDATIVLIGAGEDTADIQLLAEAIRQHRASARVSPAAGLGLNRLISLIAQLDILVGNDSAPAHLAAAAGTPTVVAYGPTSTDLVSGPVYPSHRAITLDYPCRGQALATGLPDPDDEDEDAGQCELGCACFYNGPQTPSPRCLASIGVEPMWSAATELLAGRGLVPLR